MSLCHTTHTEPATWKQLTVSSAWMTWSPTNIFFFSLFSIRFKSILRTPNATATIADNANVTLCEKRWASPSHVYVHYSANYKLNTTRSIWIKFPCFHLSVARRVSTCSFLYLFFIIIIIFANDMRSHLVGEWVRCCCCCCFVAFVVCATPHVICVWFEANLCTRGNRSAHV